MHIFVKDLSTAKEALEHRIPETIFLDKARSNAEKVAFARNSAASVCNDRVSSRCMRAPGEGRLALLERG